MTMFFQSWRLDLREAEEAIRGGRLEEAEKFRVMRVRGRTCRIHNFRPAWRSA